VKFVILIFFIAIIPEFYGKKIILWPIYK